MLFNTAALLTFAAAATVPLVDIDPNSLYINDLSNNYIKVRLTKQPATNTNVYFSATTLVFGQCATTFTPQNWNQYQNIQIRGVPQYSDMANQTYTIQARSFGFTDYSTASSKTPTVYPKIDSTFTINRNVKSGGLCSSTGDPHFNTLDNQLFSRQTGAVTRLFKNQDLEVQAWQVLCRPGNIYCNQAVAVRYGSSVFVIDNRQNITDSMQMKQLTNNVDGIVYVAPTNLLFGTHNLYIPDGSKVSISNTVYNAGLPDIHQYMGVQLSIPPQAGAYTGVCNRISATPLASFYLQDGTTVSATAANVNYFVDSYAVVSEDSIFNGNFITTTPSWRKAFTCALPASDALPVVPTPPVLPTYVQVSVPPMYDNTPKYSPSPDFIQKAIDFCTSILNSSTCISVLDPSPYIKGCVNDAALTGTQGLAEHHKQAYLQDCYSVTNNLQAVSDVNQVNKAVQIQDSCGLGNSQCPNNCNNVGTCSAIGCDCGQSGYTGVGCEILVNNFAPVVYTSSSSSASSASSSASRVSSSSASVASSISSSASRVSSSSASVASSISSSTSKVSSSAASSSASAAASSATAASIKAASVTSSASSAASSASVSSSKAWSASESVYIQATSAAVYATSSAAAAASASSSAAAYLSSSKAASQQASNNAYLSTSSNAAAQSSATAASISQSKYQSSSAEARYESSTSESKYEQSTSAASELAHETALSISSSAASASQSAYLASSSEAGYEMSTSQSAYAAASQSAYDAAQQAAHLVTLAAYEQSILSVMAASSSSAFAAQTPPAFKPDHQIKYPQCKAQKRAFGL